jgi:hypothetical protein
MRQIFVASLVANFVDKVRDKVRDEAWVAGGTPALGL